MLVNYWNYHIQEFYSSNYFDYFMKNYFNAIPYENSFSGVYSFTSLVPTFGDIPNLFELLKSLKD